MVEDATQELIMRWYDRAKIDYSDLYVRLYIAYNAWFRKVTHTEFDREGIARLEKRFVIWDDYLHGKVLQELRPLMGEAAVLTSDSPLQSTRRWDGTVKDAEDWKGLIHFWYQVRCDLFHGSIDSQETYVRLAYESLSVFMTEIVRRMRQVFTRKDHERLLELQELLTHNANSEEYIKRAQVALQDKFIQSPDIWQVDMARM